MIERRRLSRRNAKLLAAIVIMQAMAAAFFIVDAGGDAIDDGWDWHIVIEGATALSLFAGILFGAWQVRGLLLRAQQDEAAVATARGAMAELIRLRCAEWQLTGAEADVALFALKGCDVAEIARMRGAAAGTVRAQLANAYRKAGVRSQAGLIALFVEDLVDVGPPGHGEPLDQKA